MQGPKNSPVPNYTVLRLLKIINTATKIKSLKRKSKVLSTIENGSTKFIPLKLDLEYLDPKTPNMKKNTIRSRGNLIKFASPGDKKPLNINKS